MAPLLLEFSAGDAGGLLIEASPAGHSVSLRLLPSGAEVLYGGLGPLVLPWDLCGEVRTEAEGPARDGWVLAYWAANRLGVFGIGVQVSGVCATMAVAIRGAMTSRWPRPFGIWHLTGYSLPLLFTRCTPERETLQALTTVLTRKPPLRGRLADPERMRRLAADLSTGLRTRYAEFGAVLRDATDIEVAMRQVGLVHEFGRPLGDRLVPLDEAIPLIR